MGQISMLEMAKKLEARSKAEQEIMQKNADNALKLHSQWLEKRIKSEQKNMEKSLNAHKAQKGGLKVILMTALVLITIMSLGGNLWIMSGYKALKTIPSPDNPNVKFILGIGNQYCRVE